MCEKVKEIGIIELIKENKSLPNGFCFQFIVYDYDSKGFQMFYDIEGEVLMDYFISLDLLWKELN